MESKARSSFIVLFLVIIIAIVLAGSGFYMLQKEHNKNIALNQELEIVKTERQQTQDKLRNTEKMVLDLQSKLKSSQQEIEKIGADMQLERQAKEEALSKIAALETDLEQQKQIKDDLQQKLNSFQSQASIVQAQLQELDKQKKDLEVKIKDLESKMPKAENKSVELGSIVVTPAVESQAAKKEEAKKKKPEKKEKVKPQKEVKKEQPAQPPKEGKILVVNKDFDFAVINLGSKEGIKLNQVFSVYNNNNYVGDIKIEKVHESMSAAGFLSEGMKDKIGEGDKVVAKN